MGAKVEKLLMIVTLTLTLTVVSIGLLTADYKTDEKPISLPEEIQGVKQGDTLVVSKVIDSIYVQFK